MTHSIVGVLTHFLPDPANNGGRVIIEIDQTGSTGGTLMIPVTEEESLSLPITGSSVSISVTL